MTTKYLKPMLDNGSPRVFNCNELTRRIQAKTPDAPMFFRNKPMNTIVLIKDAVPPEDRRSTSAPIGTKLYFPFNETNIYEGGRTIFLHDRMVEKSIIERFGEGAISQAALNEDMRIMSVLNRLPSLDPFLMKDVFLREKIDINPAYFEVSQEAWNEIEQFMLQRFEPLISAAFPGGSATDEKARRLIEKIWEAQDLNELNILIEAFRLPRDRALDIFSAWKGINFYSFQYQRVQPQMGDFTQWIKDNEVPVVGPSAAESKEVLGTLAVVREQVRREWQKTEEILRNYEDSYDQMFKLKLTSTPFLTFLRNSDKTYWELGNSLGKANYAIYCWDVMSKRFANRKMPWAQLQEMTRLLGMIFQSEKQTASAKTW